MATIITIWLLTGRYHATPWDSTPNEGIAEPFPPPWRILRSLVAASYRLDPQQREALEKLMDKLATTLPVYRVPASTEGHLRQSVPVEAKKPSEVKKNNYEFVSRNCRIGSFQGKDSIVQRRRLIDAFRCYGPAFVKADGTTIDVCWPVELGADDRDLLSALCDRVRYLGRSQSWVQLSLAESREPLGDRANAFPVETLDKGNTKADLTLMAPLSPTALEGFRQGARALDLNKKQQALVPKTVLEALDIDYGLVQQQGWSAVPGSQFVGYCWQERRAVGRGGTLRTANRVARWRIDAEILPPASCLLELTNRLHLALTKLSDGNPVFSGKRGDEPLADGQPQHAKLLPEFNRRGQVVAVTLYARMGLDAAAVAALYKLRKLERSTDRDWYVNLEYLAADWEAADCGRVWRSLTPFVLPRWPKTERDSLVNQVRRLLVLEGLPEPVGIEPVALSSRDRLVQQVPIYRPNQRYRRVPTEKYWLRLVFAEPVRGPIAIGWNSHYGLGRFERAEG